MEVEREGSGVNMKRTQVSTPDNAKVRPANRRRFLEGLATLAGGVTIAASTARLRNGAPVQGAVARVGSMRELSTRLA